jgi:hypothetical protein
VKRILLIVLPAMLAFISTISFGPVRAQVWAFSVEQERALRDLAPDLSRLDIDENGIPSWLMGDLGPARNEPEAAAIEAMRRLAPPFV